MQLNTTGRDGVRQRGAWDSAKCDLPIDIRGPAFIIGYLHYGPHFLHFEAHQVRANHWMRGGQARPPKGRSGIRFEYDEWKDGFIVGSLLLGPAKYPYQIE